MRSRLPVLRAPRRYVAFEVDAEEKIEAKDLIHEIRSSQSSLFGDAGAARNRLKLISFQGRYGLLRCHGAYIRETRTALAAIYSINGIRAACHVKGVSGTIKSATEKYIPKLGKISSENDGRRIELEEISGCIAHTHGLEIDLCPDERNWTKGSDTRYLGLTSFDLCGGHDDADGTSDGL
ncbi:MAG TPA: Rpp14/Pop5 family protein [Methanothrix sp.]|nr:Rpp14/Pop5 family protein [Methanothrix sp.]